MPSVFKFRTFLLAACAAAALTSSASAQDSTPAPSPDGATQPTVNPDAPFVVAVEQVLVAARRREESAQEVPVALSVIGIQQIEATGSYNVAQLTQLTPSVQFFSSNPRNTAITIRGLGTSFGLTNDGLEPGVGLYIDQVYMSRPAAATFDLIDIDRVEVLRGPQGTLFGKNTTAGAQLRLDCLRRNGETLEVALPADGALPSPWKPLRLKLLAQRVYSRPVNFG